MKAEATKAEKPKPAAKAEKPKPAAKAEKPKSKPAAQGPKPPSLMPKPSKPAPKPAKEKKETFKSGNAEVVKKDTGLSPGIIVGGLATLAPQRHARQLLRPQRQVYRCAQDQAQGGSQALSVLHSGRGRRRKGQRRRRAGLDRQLEGVQLWRGGGGGSERR